MIGQVIGLPNPIAGWAYHLFNSALMGAIFGAFLGDKILSATSAAIYGAAYGFAWFIFGWTILMPMFLGLPAFAPLTMPMQFAMTASFLGHLVFGTITGLGFGRLYTPKTAEAKSQPRTPAGVR